MNKNIMFPQKYTSNGEEKTSWKQVGKLFEKDGKMTIKLDMIPIGSDGWLHCFDPKPRNEHSGQPQSEEMEAF